MIRIQLHNGVRLVFLHVGVSRMDRVRNEEVRRRAGILSLLLLLLKEVGNAML